MNALVTGGGGFLGRRIVTMLLDRGWPVRVMGRHRYQDLAALGVDCVQGDIRDMDTVWKAAVGADVVFHTAALAGFWGPRKAFFTTNVKGTANVIRACLEAKIEHLVFTSSPSVAIGGTPIEGGDESLPYPDRFLADYPASKAEAEKMVLQANGWDMVIDPERGTEADIRTLKTCALRPHLIWGPGDPHLLPTITDLARRKRLVQVGDGSNRVDITYVDNAAHAHILAAENLAGKGTCAGKAYFIGDRDPVCLWDWISTVLERIGLPAVERRMSCTSARIRGTVAEWLCRLVPALGPPPMTRFLALQLGQSHWFSHERASTDFGYTPIVSPEEGLAATVAWLRDSAAH